MSKDDQALVSIKETIDDSDGAHPTVELQISCTNDPDAPVCTPASLFVEGHLDTIISYIRREATNVTADITTKKGREALKSIAYKVRRSKTLLDEIGKKHVAELKAQTRAIDKNRRQLRETLDDITAEVRKPVTEWEEELARREQEIKENIRRIVDLGQETDGSSDAIQQRLNNLKAIEINETDFGDKQGDAAIQKDIAVKTLERAYDTAKTNEENAAELERLRKEDEERQERERIEKQKADAAEAARKEEQERANAEIRAAKEKAEKDRQEALDEAKRIREEAEERERKRKADEQREREEAERRAADKEHRRKINDDAINALTTWTNLSEEQAGDVVTVIAAGQVPAVTIKY